MVSQKLLDYIKRELEAGLSRGAITKALLKIGWSKPDIDQAFTEVRKKPVVPIEAGARRRFTYLVIGIIVIVAVAIALLWPRVPVEVVPVEEELIFNEALFGKILSDGTHITVEDRTFYPGDTLTVMVLFTNYELREEPYGIDRTRTEYHKEFQETIVTTDSDGSVISEMTNYSISFGNVQDRRVTEEFGFLHTMTIPLDILPGIYNIKILIYDKNSPKMLSRIETMQIK